MNKYFDNFQSLSSIAISGERQSGKLTFSLFCASQLTQKPITLVSPFSQACFNKKKEASLRSDSNLQSTIESIDAYNFREDWKLLKNNYGYSFLLKDIEKIIDGAERLVIFHRIDEFFEVHDVNEIENFLFNIINFSQAVDKKIIFTVNMGNANAHFIYEYFEKNIDSVFFVTKNIYNSKARDVELVSSLFSVKYTNFSFELNEKTKCFDLLPKNLDEDIDAKTSSLRVVLASQSMELAEIAKYLFGNNCFELSHIEPSLTEVTKVVDDNPQLIIFNPLANQSIIELKRISKLVSHSDIKGIFISSRPILRRQDKAEILQSGFCDVLERDFFIEDFIFSVERALSKAFYTNEIKKVPNKTYVIYDKKTFSRFIVAFLCKNLFFTVFKFKYQVSLTEEDVKKNLGRAFDVAFINKEKKLIYLFLVNTVARNSSAIEKKFSVIDNAIQLIGCKDATKYSLDYKNKET